MPIVHLRFYAHLNNHLSLSRRQTEFSSTFEGWRSIKDMIESLGVPHTEVALILVNGEPVDFHYHLHENDRISVYPAFQSIDISSVTPLHHEPLPEARFVADVHLGRLAAYLRMLGFDTLYPEDYRDEELARISSEEDRILLTRDRGLLKRGVVRYGYFVQSTEPWQQLGEVMKRFNLLDNAMKHQRCTACNGMLSVIDKAPIADQLPDKVREHYNEFRLCESCGKIYWKGSHYEQMEAFMKQMGDAR
jgi:uncharacterized protein with PIN domain/sulfur carrier protein ThiS